MDRPHSPTETVRFTLAALLVWVSTLPNDPGASSHLLLPYTSISIHFQRASSQPSKQHSSKLSLCCFSYKTLSMGKEQTDVKVSPWLTVNSFYFSSLAHSGSVTDSSAFPQPFVPLTATPAIYLHCENLNLSCWLFADLQRTQTLQRHEYRSAAKLVTWDLLEKELTWPMWKIQVLAEISVMINKFHLSKATFCWVFQCHGSFREDFWFSFIFWYLSHQSDIKSCTSFLQTLWHRQEENTNILTTCDICLGDETKKNQELNLATEKETEYNCCQVQQSLLGAARIWSFQKEKAKQLEK